MKIYEFLTVKCEIIMNIMNVIKLVTDRGL